MAIKIEGLTDAISGILHDYQDDVVTGVKGKIKENTKQLVKQTKATAPVGRRTKHYRDSISSKKLRENSQALVMLWFVKGSDYRLSHLLNNGHALRDGGRYPGTQFITKAYEQVEEQLVKDVEEVCRGGK